MDKFFKKNFKRFKGILKYFYTGKNCIISNIAIWRLASMTPMAVLHSINVSSSQGVMF